MSCPHCDGVIKYDHQLSYYVCTSCGTVFEHIEFDERSVYSRRGPLLLPTRVMGTVNSVALDVRRYVYGIAKSAVGHIPQCVSVVYEQMINLYYCVKDDVNLFDASRAVAYILCRKKYPMLMYSSPEFRKLGKPLLVVMRCMGLKTLDYDVSDYIYMYAAKFSLDTQVVTTALELYRRNYDSFNGDKRTAALELLSLAAKIHNLNTKRIDSLLKQRRDRIKLK